MSLTICSAPGNRRVVLNFARVERMSSQIVGVVVNAPHLRCADGPGGMLKICGLQTQVADIFRAGRV